MSYDSDEDDVLNEFYVPALSESVQYSRLAGFFSSTALAVAARGIYNFITNGGSMELLVSAHLSEQDVEAIRLGLESVDDALNESGLRDLAPISIDFIEDHLKALAWMVAHGKLRIKVAVVYGNDELPLNESQVEESGIFHQKVGILTDADGNTLSFSGSINETAYAWSHNIEEFKVFKGWEQSNLGWFEDDVRKFDKYWNGNAQNARIMDIPTAIKEKLISFAPPDLDGLRLNVPRATPTAERAFKIRSYQTDAIRAWKDNGFRGILSMATGTGKTYVALEATKQCVPRTTLAVVVVPTMALANQWKREISRFFVDRIALECDSSRPNWKNDLESVVRYISTADAASQRGFVVTTYQTAGSDEFRRLLNSLSSDKLCLVADEVHHAGAPYFSNILSVDFGYRMGLSATPERLWDDEGQEKVMAFFDKIVFEYPISRALKDGVLCQYQYHIIPVALTSAELDEYSRISTALWARLAQAIKENPSLKGLPLPQMLRGLSAVDEQAFQVVQTLMIKRVNILKRAQNKSEAIKEIIKKKGLGRCLIYCNAMEHLNETLQTLSDLNVGCLRYDSSLTHEQRSANLHSFEESSEGFLVAIKCLDEGVDIPSCDSAILVASSKSSREFIQRRGRLLRQSPGKTSALIYDIIVLPVSPAESSRGITSLEYSVVDNELRRSRIFAESASNSSDILLDISRLEAELASKVHNNGAQGA